MSWVGPALLAGALLASSCRTEIRPLVKSEPRATRREAPGECSVHDYASATDVPAGAENLGWVAVPRQPTDDETFNTLREAVCAKGGNAFSQAHWNRAAGASIADPPTDLEANAWVEAR